MAGACIYLFLWKKKGISELIEDSNAEIQKDKENMPFLICI